MKTEGNMKRTVKMIVGLSTLIILSLACGTGIPRPLATTASTASTQAVETPAPTLENPTEKSTQTLENIREVGQPSFIQYHNVIEYTFKVENPNQGVMILNTQYSTTVSDVGGSVLASTPRNLIFTLLPGEQISILSYLNVKDGEKAAKVEVTPKPGSGIPRSVNLTSPLFPTQQPRVIHFTGNDTYAITGFLQSNLDQNMVDRINSEVRITGLAFDQAGNFIGGGYQDLVYLPAKSKIPFEIPVNVLTGTPARVELYPQLTDYDIFQIQDAGENLVSVVAQNVVVDPVSYVFRGGFIVQNTDPQRAIENLVYQITAYDSEGVLATYSQPLYCLLFPGEKTGIAVNNSGIPTGAKYDRLEIQVGSGKIYTGSLTAIPLQADSLVFVPGENPKITGVIKNLYGKDFSDFFEVDTLAFDAKGSILAGGQITITAGIPANGSTSFEVFSLFPNLQTDPAKIEAYIKIDASRLQP
jgi:hypothetical protein